VGLPDAIGPASFGEFARRPEQVERAPGVAVFLGGEGRTQRDDLVGEHTVDEGDLRAMGEDVAQLVRVVGGEDDLLFP
jgi:hypothetical protein